MHIQIQKNTLLAKTVYPHKLTHTHTTFCVPTHTHTAKKRAKAFFLNFLFENTCFGFSFTAFLIQILPSLYLFDWVELNKWTRLKASELP